VKKYLKEIWLFTSAFGILFAALSWVQESMQGNILKGTTAFLLAIVLYLIIKKVV